MIARYVVPLLLIMTSIGVGMFYIDREFRIISGLRADILQLDIDIAEANQATDKQKQLMAEYAELPAEGLAKLDAMIPSDVNPVRLIIDLTALGAKHGVQLRGVAVTPDSIKEKTPDRGAKINFTLSATYGTFRAFMADVEKSLLLREPASVKISLGSFGDVTGNAPRPSNGDPIMTYSVDLHHYWLNREAQ